MKNKIYIKVMTLLMALSLTMMPVLKTAAHAQNLQEQSDELKKQQEELEKKQKEAEQKKKDQAKDVKNLEKEQDKLESDVKTLNNNIASVRSEIENAQEEYEKTNDDIAQLNDDIAKAEADKAAMYDRMKEQIVYTYERDSGVSMISMLFESGSMSEFLSRAEYIIAIQNYNDSILEQYTGIVEEINSKSKKLNQKQSDLEAYSKTMNDKQDELNKLLGVTNQKLDLKNAELATAQTDLNEIDKEISGYKQQVAQIEAQVTAANIAMAKQVAEAQAQAAAELAAKEQAAKDAQVAADGSKASYDQAQQIYDAASAKLEEAQQRLSSAEANVTAAQTALETAQNQSGDVESAQKAYNDAVAARDAVKAEIDPLQQDVAAKSTQLAQCKAAYEAALAEAEQKAKEAEEARKASGISTSAGSVYAASASEQEILSAIIQAEAGNQGYAGKLAVASVIMNRVYSPSFRQNNIRDVVYARNQFEPTRREMVVKQNGVWVKTGMTVMEFYLSHPESVDAESRQAAAAAISGQRYSAPNGPMNQLFFMTPAALQGCIASGWPKAEKVRDQFTLGGHTFFNVAS
ncbi:MAG: cell wall hydrolase [Lachnospiraceae bacterium]|nr:cell wall hydrolase [Lachnospiraceae bacterium]MEE3432982.1 cell wall hydrolase [Lachnospiraceae bacterium]